MEIYLLKSSGCLLAFYIFYKAFFETTSFHFFKRFYLLLAVVLSFGIPFITFTSYVSLPIAETKAFVISETSNVVPTTIIEEKINYTPIILWSLYFIGVAIFGFRFFRNLNQIILKIKSNPTLKVKKYTHVLLGQKVVPHTFLRYIFFSKRKIERNEIPPEVIIHEEAHAKQKHTLDVLFLELLQILFWFNPLLYFIKKSAKLNHEFLADASVLHQGFEPTKYQKTLLAFSSNALTPQLAHSINYSSIKKRFTVMKTQTSKKNLGLKSLLLLPLLALLLYGFSTKKEVFNEPTEVITTNPDLTARSMDIKILNDGTYELNGIKTAKKTLARVASGFHQDISTEDRNNILNIHIIQPKVVPNEEVQFIFDALWDYGFYRLVAGNQEVVRGKGNRPIANPNTQNLYKDESKKGASREQMKEYNALAKRYNAIAIEKRVIKLKDLERLETIYRLMSDKQKTDAEPFPECLPPKPNKKSKSTQKTYAQEYLEGAERNNKKAFVLEIINNKIKLNNKYIKLKNFARKLDEYTKDWEETDYTSAHPSILIKGSSKEFLNKVEAEFQKTRYAKANGGFKLLPPPPPPPPALDKKDPPPPPPPPAPPVPLDHVIEMAKEGATFYYNNKKITSDEAIGIVKKNKNINISTNTNNGTHVVKLSN